MADFGRSAVPLDMRFFLLRNEGEGNTWTVKVVLPETRWWDLFTLTDYPDEKEAEGVAAFAAEYRYRKYVRDHRTQLIVNRVHVEPATAEEA